MKRRNEMENNVRIDTVKTNTEQTAVFDKQEWMRQKSAERESAFRMMDEMTDLIKMRTSDLRNFLDLMARLPGFSVGNLLLVAAQKPDATSLRDFGEWKALGTSIKKGQTGIMLLEAGKEYRKADGTAGMRYNIKRVFDISQTKALSNPEVPFQYQAQRLLDALMSGPLCEVITYADMEEDAVYDTDNSVIRLRDGLRTSDAVKALSRETARACLCSGDHIPDNADETAVCASYVFLKRKGADLSDTDLSRVTSCIKDMDNRQIRNIMNRVRGVSWDLRDLTNGYFRQQKEQEQER